MSKADKLSDAAGDASSRPYASVASIASIAKRDSAMTLDLAEQSFSISALHRAYREKRWSPSDIIHEALRRIAAMDQPVFLHLAASENLISQARECENLLANHADALEHWPLLGIPFAVKDNIDVEGMPTTAACPSFSHLAASSAPTVAALLQAGAICLGKTNMDQFATGLVGVRSPYGACRNVFVPDFIAGGSSSGSGVAVASGMCSFSLGTDTAGSGRVPAALGNIVGLKPTRGLVSTRGVVPACPSLDCVSVFALSADDAEKVLSRIEGFDAEDPWSRARPGLPATAAATPVAPVSPKLPKAASDETAAAAASVSPRLPEVGGTEVASNKVTAAQAAAFKTIASKSIAASWNALRVAMPLPGQLNFSGNDEFARLYRDSTAYAQDLGASLQARDVAPLLEAALLLYQGPWIAERYAAIAESADPESDAVMPLLSEVIRAGRDLRATEVFRGQRRLQTLRRASESLFQTCDILLLPTLPTAYTLAEVAANPIALNGHLGRFTNFVNLLDLSALALPFGFCANGLPFGITLIAPAFHDGKLLDLAKTWQAKLPFGAGKGKWIVANERPPLPAESATEAVNAIGPGNPSATVSERLPLLVFGLHLKGQALAKDLENLGATFSEATLTAEGYAMYDLQLGTKRLPGVVRKRGARGRLHCDIWSMPKAGLGSFITTVNPPLSLGYIQTESGKMVLGFLAETQACEGQQDITAFGGWLSFMASLSKSSS